MTDTFTFNIVSRLDSSRVLFTAELEAKYESEPRSIQIGAAVRPALKRGANLRDANLRDANLWGANLGDAVGISARIIDGGLRSDGYRFLLTRTEPGEWRVQAGCRNFTVSEAINHWTDTRGDTPLGKESIAIVEHMVAVAGIRDWPEQGEERPESEAA